VTPIQVTDASRVETLRRARVWQPPRDHSVTSLVTTPDPLHTLSAGAIECLFQPEPARGTTAKFNCILADGEVVKVKYGRTEEIHAEVAASRLLTRLGFAADHVFVVERVRCFGCPRLPFELSWIADRFELRDAVLRRFSSERYVDFPWTAVERRFSAPAIESDTVQGWAWYELEAVDPSAGANRIERDALRLAAVFLAHWDNKAANQRLVCLDVNGDPAHHCEHPFAMIHDLGATFGPNKVDLAAWRAAPIWSDATQCTVSMRQFPYDGGTFPDAHISESGRRLLLRELETISGPDARAWLESARFRNSDGWTAAFLEKVRQIRNAGPCPTT
jgi:hypothetical protein